MPESPDRTREQLRRRSVFEDVTEKHAHKERKQGTARGRNRSERKQTEIPGLTVHTSD